MISIIDDWEFWSFVVAGLALVLSQVPHVRLWFRRPRLAVEANASIVFMHSFNPQVNIYLSVENVGGRRVRVNTIVAELKRDGRPLVELPVQGFFESPTSPQSVFFRPFDLDPDQQWSKQVVCFALITREEDRAFRKERSRASIDLQKNESAVLGGVPAVVGPETYQAIVARFNKNFIWEHGDYELTIRVKTNRPGLEFDQCYRFTLFESDRDELKAVASGFITGHGVVYEPKNFQPLWSPLQLL